MHVSPGDGPFIARIRFHQSWYRRMVLNLEPGVHPKNGLVYGSQLTERDGLAGANFLTSDIHDVALARLASTEGLVDKERLLFNMLSSQPMCFNMFGPLTLNADAATQLLRTLPGLSKDLVVTNVRLEHAPDKTTHLNDHTAFDAFVEYGLPGGRNGFVGVECKLTEPFSQGRYSFAERYSRWMAAPNWYWNAGAEQYFSQVRYNQLWRNHLLAFSMLHQGDAKYDEAFCAVVYHDNDSSCDGAMDAYVEHLRPEFRNTLLRWPLGTILDAWSPRAGSVVRQEWLTKFHRRYLGLAESEAAWVDYRQRSNVGSQSSSS